MCRPRYAPYRLVQDEFVLKLALVTMALQGIIPRRQVIGLNELPRGRLPRQNQLPGGGIKLVAEPMNFGGQQKSPSIRTAVWKAWDARFQVMTGMSATGES